MFPQYKAAVSLEDAMVLGGFSVLGYVVNSLLAQELVRIEEELRKEKREFFLRTRLRKHFKVVGWTISCGVSFLVAL